MESKRGKKGPQQPKKDEIDTFFENVRLPVARMGDDGQIIVDSLSADATPGPLYDSMRLLTAGVDLKNLLAKKDDRSLAIVGVSFVEELLARLLKKAFIPGKWKHMFSPDGAFGTIGRRTDTAEALALIGREAAAEIRQLALIRNKFAHKFHLHDFEVEQIRIECEKLTAYRELEGQTLTAREKFSFSLTYCMREVGRLYRFATPRNAPPTDPLKSE